jgi:hypothetical protein
MVTGRNASSGSVAMKATAFPAFTDIRMACAASTAIKGSAIIQALEAATKTNPMAKTEARPVIHIPGNRPSLPLSRHHGYLIAAVIIMGLPGSALWAVGLLVGINLLFGGASLIGMALAARDP